MARLGDRQRWVRRAHPGVVVQWQYLPVHNATASGWAALVVHVPFEGAVAMEWVPAERVEPIADPAPQER